MSGRDHFYHRLPHFFDYEDVYREAVSRAPKGGHLIELGVYEGASLAFLAVEALNSGKDLMICGIDLFQNSHDHFERVRRVFNENGLASVNLWKESTSNASQLISGGACDFVFIDADHAEDSVFRDCELYHPKLKPGGYLAGHDLCDEFPGVEKAVNRFYGNRWTRKSKRCWEGPPK